MKSLPMAPSSLPSAAFVPLDDNAFGAESPTTSSAYTLVDEEQDTRVMAMQGYYHGAPAPPAFVSTFNSYTQTSPCPGPSFTPQSVHGYHPTGMVAAQNYAQRSPSSIHAYEGFAPSPPSTFYHPQVPCGPTFSSPYPPDHAPVFYTSPFYHGSPTYPPHTHFAFTGLGQGPYDKPPPYGAHDKSLFSPIDYQGPLAYSYPPPTSFSHPRGFVYHSPPAAHMPPASPTASGALTYPSVPYIRPPHPPTIPRDTIREPHAVRAAAVIGLGQQPPASYPAPTSLPVQAAKPDNTPAKEHALEEPTVILSTDPHVFKPRSALLVQFRANRNREWSISDVKGHVPEFSQDLFASRFIQDSITAGSEIDLIFEELSVPGNLIAVSMNSSGNYVVQKLLINASMEQRLSLSDTLLHHLAQLSLDTYGCRVVQTFIDLAPYDLQARIAKETEFHILKFVKDVNANHVVQKLLTVAPTCMEFIVPLLKGRVIEVARDDYGCRVLQRCIHDLRSPVIRPLIEEFLPFTLEMATHEFGNFVVQKLLEQGSEDDKHIILQQLQGNFLRCAQHKYGSNVCERVLECVDPSVRQPIIREMLVLVNHFPKGVYQLMVHQYGNYVLQKALKIAEEPERSELLMAARQQLAYARRAKCNPGHRNRDKQLESIEVLLDRSHT